MPEFLIDVPNHTILPSHADEIYRLLDKRNDGDTGNDIYSTEYLSEVLDTRHKNGDINLEQAKDITLVLFQELDNLTGMSSNDRDIIAIQNIDKVISVVSLLSTSAPLVNLFHAISTREDLRPISDELIITVSSFLRLRRQNTIRAKVVENPEAYPNADIGKLEKRYSNGIDELLDMCFHILRMDQSGYSSHASNMLRLVDEADVRSYKKGMDGYQLIREKHLKYLRKLFKVRIEVFHGEIEVDEGIEDLLAGVLNKFSRLAYQT